ETFSHIITEALKIKGSVVEADERESGVRKILNFGHTLGHGIEASEGLSGLYHGECVALGMLPMLAPDARKRVVPVLKKLGLPTVWRGDIEKALEFTMHDKKRRGGKIDVVTVKKIGSYTIEALTKEELKDLVFSVDMRNGD
ncbi:MAG: 3-dehydroquinate synthase, partial [Clostridia bacterium]|nr:3-dehydroquinate synthase [Clostridia bacterium]